VRPGALHVADRSPLLRGQRQSDGHAGQTGRHQVHAAQYGGGKRLQRLGNPSHDGVLERKDGLVDEPLVQGVENLLEAGERHGDCAVRSRCDLAEGARLALVADLQVGRSIGGGILGLTVGDLTQHG